MTIIIVVNVGILIIKYKTTSIRIEALRTQGHVQICHVAPTAIASSPSSLQILSFPSQTHLNVRHHLAEQMTLLFLLILSNIGLFLSKGGGRYGIHTQDCAVDFVQGNKIMEIPCLQN